MLKNDKKKVKMSLRSLISFFVVCLVSSFTKIGNTFMPTLIINSHTQICTNLIKYLNKVRAYSILRMSEVSTMTKR